MAARVEQRVEELVIRGKVEGLQEATTKLQAIEASFGRAHTAAEGAAKGFEYAGRSIRNPIAAAEQLDKKLAGSARAISDFERALRITGAAAASGKADLDGLARTADNAARAFAKMSGIKISPDADLSSVHALTLGVKELDAATHKQVVGQLQQIEAMEASAIRAAKLRAGFDDLKAAQERLNAGLAEANELRGSGAFSDDDVIRRTRQLNEEFTEQSKRLGVANDNLKLTQGQMQGLGYQINDIGTMLAMGASPFQIIASQAGQVVQVLQEGGGVKASLAAIGLATVNAGKVALGALGPIGIGFAAITTAAGVFALATRRKIPDATETLKKHDDVLSAISDRYEGLADKVKLLGEASSSALGVQAGAVGRDLQTVIGEQRKALERSLVGGNSYVGTSLFGTDDTKALSALPQFGPISAQLDAFRAKLRDNGGDVIALRKELAETYATAGNDEPLRKAIEAFFQFSSAMADSQKAIEANKEAIKALDPELQRITQRAKGFHDAMDVLKGLGPVAETTADKIANAFADANATAQSLGEAQAAANAQIAATAEAARPSLEALADAKNRLANLKLSPDQRTLAEIRQRADAEIAELERTNKVKGAIENREKQRDAELEAASIEIQRREEARRAGYELDLKSIGDRTAAQKANTAAERAYIDALAAGEGETEAARRREQARTLSMAQASGQLAESQRQQTEATSRQIEQAQLEYDLVGKSAGEVARLQAEFQLLAQAKDAARSAGFDADTVTLTDKMREQAAEIGRLTEATQRLNFERDLMFDRSQASRSPEDQRIAEQLRSIGVEFDSAQGKVYAGQLRVNERLHEANDALYEMRDAGKEAFADLVSSIGTGKGAMDGLLKTAGDLFNKFASAGWGKLFDGLSGKSSAGSAGLLSVLGGALSGSGGGSVSPSGSASGFVPTPTQRPEYVAQAAAAVSGQVMSYAGRFNSSVDTRLLKILNEASSRFDMRVEAISGLRPGDSRYHGKGLATDVQIYDGSGKALGNYQDASTFRAYERFAQLSKQVQSELFPELEGMLRWGGYFSGGKGKYGALDTMHFDLAGKNVGMGGGSWENGLTSQQRRLWANAQSVGMSKSEFQRTISQGTSQGLKEAVRGGSAESYQNGNFDAGTPSNPNGSRQLSGGQQALMGLAGLFGAFSGGYQSGSPVGGALNGAMGGFEVGSSLSFLGAAGGPIGAGIGAIAGIIGGVLGKRKQKKQEQEEARRQWDGMQPQYEAYRRYLLGEESGNLRADFQNIQTQFNTFQAASVKAGKGELGDAAKSFYAYVQKQLADVREGLGGVAADLEAGAGMDGPFSKGKSAIKQLQKQLLGYIDDVEIAFFKADNGLQGGAPFAAAEIAWKEERERNVALAKRAAQNQALSVLNPAKELSAVESNFRSLEGAAQQLLVTLPKLGLGIEDTAKRVAEEFAAGRAVMRGDFEQTMADRLLGLQDKGYVTDTREMIAEFHQLTKEAGLLGADTSGFAETFRLSAQDIVDGAELTGDAFNELVQRFPELAGVVREFSATAAQSAKELAQSAIDTARSNLDRSYQAETGRINDLISARRDEASELESTIDSLKSFANSIADFRKSLLVDDSLSTLDPAARLAEARRQFLDLSAKAQAGDEDARSQLTGAGQEYLTEARDFYASSEGYYDAFDEVRRTLDQSEGWARSQLSTSSAQLAAVKQQIGLAEAQLAVAQSQYNAILGANEGLKSLQLALAEMAVAIAQGRNAGLTVPGQTGASTPVTDRSMAYLANNPDVAKAIAGGQTFGVTTGSVEDIINAHWQQWGQYEVGKGTRVGFSRGGFTGGSSASEVRGPVHGLEYVFDAESTRAFGVSTLDTMRQTRRLPALVADPYPRGDLSNRASGDSSMGAQMKALQAAVERLGDQLAMVLHGEGEETRAVLRKGNRTAKQQKDLVEFATA